MMKKVSTIASVSSALRNSIRLLKLKFAAPLLVLLASTQLMMAQQDAQYSQYMFNGLVLNPAYAGSRECLSMNAFFRAQWLGIEKSAMTQSFSLHGPSRNRRHGYGVSFINDKIGVTNNMVGNLMYAFRIPMGEKATLSLGMQGSINNYRADFTSLYVPDANDPSFTGNNVNLFLPNAGAGVYFQTNTLFLGASAPKLINNSLAESGAPSAAVQARHFVFNGGLVLKLSDHVKFMPSALGKFVPGSPFQMDFNGSFYFDDKFWIGASYRMDDAVVFLAEFWIKRGFRVGYAYDYTLSSLRTWSGGSHELSLGLDLNFDRKYIVTPRYF